MDYPLLSISGKNVTNSGIKIKMATTTISAAIKGKTPIKICPNGIFGATLRTTKQLSPTGGETSPISVILTTKIPNHIG